MKVLHYFYFLLSVLLFFICKLTGGEGVLGSVLIILGVVLPLGMIRLKFIAKEYLLNMLFAKIVIFVLNFNLVRTLLKAPTIFSQLTLPVLFQILLIAVSLIAIPVAMVLALGYYLTFTLGYNVTYMIGVGRMLKYRWYTLLGLSMVSLLPVVNWVVFIILYCKVKKVKKDDR